MEEKGLLIVISGPAGSGKGTVCAKLLASPEYAFSVSATTRAPRPGEVNGKNYWFITREEFEARIAKGEMLEYTEYCGNYYGTPRKEAEAVLKTGKHLLLEIEVVGGTNVKKLCPEAVLIMLLPPSFREQEARLRGRATETEQKIRERLVRTRAELEYLPTYDYVVYNREGGADECAEEIRAIVRAEKSAVRHNPGAKEAYFGEPERKP